MSRKLLIPDAQMSLSLSAKFASAEQAKLWVVQQLKLAGSYDLTVTHGDKVVSTAIRMVK